MIFESLKNKVPNNHSLKQKINDDILIVSSRKLEIFYLNNTAKDFLLLCDGVRSLNDIKNELLCMYDVDAATLEEDIVELVRDLQWMNLIVLKGSL